MPTTFPGPKKESGFWCTIVSLMPQPIAETKPGLVPSVFRIPAARIGDFEILHVTTTFYPMYIDQERGSFKVPVPPDQLAMSFVDDYINSQLGVSRDPDNPAFPGLFYVPGKLTKDEVKREYGDALEDAKNNQVNWFKSLVKLADDDWQRYRQHKTISDLQRWAAKFIGFQADWMVEVKAEATVGTKTCPACYSNIHPKAVVCPICKCTLDAEAIKKLSFEMSPAPVGGQSGAVSK